MWPDENPHLAALADPEVKRKLEEAASKAVMEAFKEAKLIESDRTKYLTYEQMRQQEAATATSLMNHMYAEKRLIVDTEIRVLDAIFDQLVPTWADTEWEEMSDPRRHEWAKMLVCCPRCDVPRGQSCHNAISSYSASQHIIAQPHFDRVTRAGQIYTERREKIFQRDVDRTCPWCGLMCEDPTALAEHEQECD